MSSVPSSSSSVPRRSSRLSAKYGRHVDYEKESYKGSLGPRASRSLFLQHKTSTDPVNPLEVSYADMTYSNIREYLHKIRFAESYTEKVVLVSTFFKFLIGIPRFLAMNPTILRLIVKERIAAFKDEFKNIADDADPEIAATFQQRLEDITFVLADEKDAKVIYYGNM